VVFWPFCLLLHFYFWFYAQRELSISKLPFVLFYGAATANRSGFAFVCGEANTPANAFIAQGFPCEHHGTTVGRWVLLPVRSVL
jgi:hypothetical protein